MGKQIEIKWLPEPEEKNYPAAAMWMRKAIPSTVSVIYGSHVKYGGFR
ncbi:hypothetical protein [Oryzomonas rubra]|nr:hypothetical protein [Oryzomonas rubra]